MGYTYTIHTCNILRTRNSNKFRVLQPEGIYVTAVRQVGQLAQLMQAFAIGTSGVTGVTGTIGVTIRTINVAGIICVTSTNALVDNCVTFGSLLLRSICALK